MDTETREQAPLGKSVLHDLELTGKKCLMHALSENIFVLGNIPTYLRTKKSLLG